MRTRAMVDPMNTPETSAIFSHYYAGNNDPGLPLISPLYGNLHGLPPMLIHVGHDEILLDDSTRLADRAREAGVAVTLKVWDNMWHVFPLFVPFLPEARQAIDDIGAFVRTRIS